MEIETDFIKNLKGCHITFMPELPPEGIKVEENTEVVVPGPFGQFKLYTRFEGKWVLTSTINISDFDIKDIKDACDDLENAIKKLNKVISGAENDEKLSLKLLKITTKILQVKYELIDDVLEPFERN